MIVSATLALIACTALAGDCNPPCDPPAQPNGPGGFAQGPSSAVEDQVITLTGMASNGDFFALPFWVTITTPDGVEDTRYAVVPPAEDLNCDCFIHPLIEEPDLLFQRRYCVDPDDADANGILHWSVLIEWDNGQGYIGSWFQARETELVGQGGIAGVDGGIPLSCSAMDFDSDGWLTASDLATLLCQWDSGKWTATELAFFLMTWANNDGECLD